MRIAVVGLGAVGARAARQLASTEGVDEVLLRDIDDGRRSEVAASLGAIATPEPQSVTAPPEADAVVLALPAGDHAAAALPLVERGVPVVSTSDSVGDVEALLDLGPLAEAVGTTLVLGAAFSPGLSCLLARHAADLLDDVTEVHVARAGTGGPACAHQHHRALGGSAIDWRNGGWQRRAAGSGRELCWFPDPVGAADCYRAGLPDALLLVNALGPVERVTARLAATRRDRLTARLPMLRRPHPEGVLGAVRAEVRGRVDGRYETVVYGAFDRPGVAAGAVAAVAAVAAVRGDLGVPAGAHGLGASTRARELLGQLAVRGVKSAAFTG
ncbi:Gfo/Idh/MocA family oxidoreductase [Iamia sp. SCSIO 61187]|uniref:Gfo/Idh/MocA family oxidoreductase n=1 Tax=Iamia sp. SCSIO 61187 TaxID=2722752 RepID=UPI001C632619|nr:Gfo/Idh/MocA family oxidoreductase [Iamia sp. SCSIO 61187]QYG90981.1 Gfo/Idh/MocA family oxidoreductase [Iamia sp. SCSIO 61187]